MRIRLSLILPVVMLFFAVGAKAGEKKPSEGESPAVAAFSEGVRLFNAAQHEEAVAEFRKAYRLKPAWKILYNIGQCEAALTRYGLAIEAFEAYLGEGGDKVALERRDEVLSELDRMRKMVGGIKVSGREGVEVYVDDIKRGTTPVNSSILVTAGVRHGIVFRKDEEEISSITETVRGGDIMELEIPDAPPEVTPPPEVVPEPGPAEPAVGGGDAPPEEVITPPEEAGGALGGDGPGPGPVQTEKRGISPVVFWVGAGVTVVFGGATLGLALAVDSKWDKAKKASQDPWSFNSGSLDDIRMMQILTYASMGIGAAGLIMTAVAVPFTDWGGDDSPVDGPRVGLRPWSGALGGGLMLDGRF